MHAMRDGQRSYPKPRWGWLYALVVLLGGLLTVIEVALPDGLARRTLELSVVVAMLTAMALWVRANRVALALANEDHPARVRAPVGATTARDADGTATYNRAWPWTTAVEILKRSSSGRTRKKPGSTAAS